MGTGPISKQCIVSYHQPTITKHPTTERKQTHQVLVVSAFFFAAKKVSFGGDRIIILSSKPAVGESEHCLQRG